MISFQSLKLLAASSFLAVCVSLPSHAGVHVNVNVGIGTPGYYGVLPIQGVTPSLWNANPIVAIGAALAGAPIYLTVPANTLLCRIWCLRRSRVFCETQLVQQALSSCHSSAATSRPRLCTSAVSCCSSSTLWSTTAPAAGQTCKAETR